MSLRVRRVIGICVVVLLLASSAVYAYVFVLPKRHLTEVLVEFERSCRTNDIASLEMLVSKDAPIYGKWSVLRDEFAKFEQGIHVDGARFVSGEPISEQTMITGDAKMRAKIDGEYRFFADVELIQVEGSWRLRQFAFPDYLDY